MPSRRVSKNISHRHRMRNERSLIDFTVDELSLSPKDKLLKRLRDPKVKEKLDVEMRKLGGSIQKIMNIFNDPPTIPISADDFIKIIEVDNNQIGG